MEWFLRESGIVTVVILFHIALVPVALAGLGLWLSLRGHGWQRGLGFGLVGAITLVGLAPFVVASWLNARDTRLLRAANDWPETLDLTDKSVLVIEAGTFGFRLAPQVIAALLETGRPRDVILVDPQLGLAGMIGRLGPFLSAREPDYDIRRLGNFWRIAPDSGPIAPRNMPLVRAEVPDAVDVVVLLGLEADRYARAGQPGPLDPLERRAPWVLIVQEPAADWAALDQGRRVAQIANSPARTAWPFVPLWGDGAALLPAQELDGALQRLICGGPATPENPACAGLSTANL